MAEDRDKAFAAGCEAYITKPFNSAELKERLRQFVRQHGQAPAEAPAEGAPR